MDEHDLRQECLAMLEKLFAGDEETLWPTPAGVRQITVRADLPGYCLATDIGVKAYQDAEAVLNSLIAVERMAGTDEPLASVHASLHHIS